MNAESAATQDRDRLLPWIAAERALRTVLLLAVGIVLLTHPHANWANDITHFVKRVGLDPNSNWVRKIVAKVKKVGASESTLFGAIAVGFAVLEGTEAYGLFTRKRWGEWLTVLATSLLLIPEAWELTKSVTALKLGGLLVNLAVVAYLASRLRRKSRVKPALARADELPDGHRAEAESEVERDVRA